MARNRKWILYWEGDHWQIYQVRARQFTLIEASEVEDISEVNLLEQIWQALETAGYASEPVLVALGASVCVQEQLTLPTPRTGRNRTAMSYLLEPALPWAAEEVAHDYRLQGTSAYAVAAESAPLAELLQFLEEKGVRISSITPLAELALEHHLKTYSQIATRYVLLWGNEVEVNLWLIEKGNVVRWEVIPHELADVVLSIKQVLLTDAGPLSIAVRKVDPEIVDELQKFSELDFLVTEWSEPTALIEAGLTQTLPILAEKRAAPIELYQDELISQDRNRPTRGYLGLFQMSLMFLLLLTAWGLYFQIGQFDQLRKDYGADQTELFRKVFPQRKARVGVLLPLKQELSRLRGLQGGSGEIPEVTSALAVTLSLLEGLPADFRFRLTEIRIKEGQLNLVGQVREHADADRFAQHLQKAGLVTESPRTHVLPEKGVEFRLEAVLSKRPTEGEEPAP